MASPRLVWMMSGQPGGDGRDAVPRTSPVSAAARIDMSRCRVNHAVVLVAAKGVGSGRARAVLTLATLLAGLCLLAACGGTSKPAKAASRRAVATVHVSTLEPVTVNPASEQLKWVIGAINRGSALSPADSRGTSPRASSAPSRRQNSSLRSLPWQRKRRLDWPAFWQATATLSFRLR